MKPWLVVEDEEDIRNIVKVMFTAWGRTSIDFRDGNQTFAWLDKVEAGTYEGELPELVLMDIKMPGPRGNEIARRMRTIDSFKNIPIIMMTAFTLEDEERQAMVREDGVDFIINKPLPDFFALKTLLEEIFEKKKSRVSASQHKTGEIKADDAKQAVEAKPAAKADVKPAAESDTKPAAEAKSAAKADDAKPAAEAKPAAKADDAKPAAEAKPAAKADDAKPTGTDSKASGSRAKTAND